MSGSSGYGSGSSGPTGPVVETLTGNTGGAVGPTANNINIIGAGDVLVTGDPGTSTLTITTSGAVTDEYDTDDGTAIPSGGILNIVGGPSTAGTNINTTGSGNTVDVILNDSLFFPNTTADGTEGVLYWGGDTFIHNYGPFVGNNNTFVGVNAGNLDQIPGPPPGGGGNSGFGSFTLTELTSGEANTAIGAGALSVLTTGTNNVAMGEECAVSLVSGSENVIIGANAAIDAGVGEGLISGSWNIIIGSGGNSVDSAGQNYTSNESSNILLQHPGMTGDQNTMRLGVDGSGNGEQNSTFMAGIYNRSFASPSGVVQIDDNFKLGSSAGTNGQLLIGSTGASPLWANLTSTGGSVVITNNANAINLEATGTGAGASSFPTDSGTATEAAGVLNVFGGANINTSATGNTVVVNLNEFISLPNTNSAADEGVLFLGSNTFLHNFGTENTFLGQAAGNQTLTTGSAKGNTGIGTEVLQSLTIGSNNTSVGDQSLKSLTSGLANQALGYLSLSSLTSGQSNSALGFENLQFLTTGSRNIAVGFVAGNNYTSSESDNILIGNTGTNGETGSIRIGSSLFQSAAYMAGIFEASIGSTNAAVFIDSTGKLGTAVGGSSDSQAFLATITNTITPQFAPLIIFNTTRTGTYTLGTADVNGNPSTLSVIYDVGSNLFAGDGASSPATYTAPITGKYSLTFNACFFGNGLITTGSGAGILGIQVIITTTARTYSLTLSPVYYNPGNGQQSASSVSVEADMTAGDVATWTVFAANSVLGVNNGIGLLSSGTSNPLTWISGNLIQ
jgi:trimeric autotransporter adhesin